MENQLNRGGINKWFGKALLKHLTQLCRWRRNHENNGGVASRACQKPTRPEDQQRRTQHVLLITATSGTALHVVPLLLLNREHLYRATWHCPSARLRKNARKKVQQKPERVVKRSNADSWRDTGKTDNPLLTGHLDLTRKIVPLHFYFRGKVFSVTSDSASLNRNNVQNLH